MTIKSFTFNPFQTNCYVAYHEGEAVIVDPSCVVPVEQQAVLDYLEKHDLKVRHLLLTHAHIDHIFGCAFFAEHFGMGWQLHRADLPLLRHGKEQAEMFGIDLRLPPEPVSFLNEGDTVAFGGATWAVLHTPGHSPGSVCFHDADGGYVLAGDVLFQGSIGRTDLWEGSLPTLMRSIFNKLAPLGEVTQVYPGHGPVTTVGRELQHNPFLTGGFAEMGR